MGRSTPTGDCNEPGYTMTGTTLIKGREFRGQRWCARTARGFTLIELMIVIAIMLILIGIAAGMYQRSVVRAREAVLKSDLKVMRQAIDNYTLDKEAAPQSLEDLTNPPPQ